MLVIAKIFKKTEVNVVSSLDVAETFSKEHYHVMEDIRTIQGKISTPEFSGLFYESSYIASNGKKNPMYYMNRDGFTLLAMGYTGEKAMRFKLAYINQFNEMERMLRDKQIERAKGIMVRQTYAQAIKDSKENERMHGNAYSNYTNVIYRHIFGKDAKALREEYGITKKDNLRDFFSESELEKVRKMETLTTSLIDVGMTYEEIKEQIARCSKRMIEICE